MRWDERLLRQHAGKRAANARQERRLRVLPLLVADGLAGRRARRYLRGGSTLWAALRMMAGLAAVSAFVLVPLGGNTAWYWPLLGSGAVLLAVSVFVRRWRTVRRLGPTMAISGVCVACLLVGFCAAQIVATLDFALSGERQTVVGRAAGTSFDGRHLFAQRTASIRLPDRSGTEPAMGPGGRQVTVGVRDGKVMRTAGTRLPADVLYGPLGGVWSTPLLDDWRNVPPPGSGGRPGVPRRQSVPLPRDPPPGRAPPSRPPLLPGGPGSD